MNDDLQTISFDFNVNYNTSIQLRSCVRNQALQPEERSDSKDKPIALVYTDSYKCYDKLGPLYGSGCTFCCKPNREMMEITFTGQEKCIQYAFRSFQTAHRPIMHAFIDFYRPSCSLFAAPTLSS